MKGKVHTLRTACCLLMHHFAKDTDNSARTSFESIRTPLTTGTPWPADGRSPCTPFSNRRFGHGLRWVMTASAWRRIGTPRQPKGSGISDDASLHFSLRSICMAGCRRRCGLLHQHSFFTWVALLDGFSVPALAAPDQRHVSQESALAIRHSAGVVSCAL